MLPPADHVNILLVDDHPENLLALEATLEPLGHCLVKATSGSEALKHLLSHEFAVILLDVRMPDMDGFETAVLIRQREKTRHVPVIFITANNKDERQVLQAYSIGAVDYIAKPFEPEILRSKVSIFVELFEQAQEIKRYAEEERKGLATRQRRFLRDVLASVTEGRLHVCDTISDLPTALPTVVEPLPLSDKGSLHELRRRSQEVAIASGFADDRWQDLVTAVGEAGMNAVMHGRHGIASICADNAEKVQVWIEDRGTGIDLECLPRATMERGYTTAGSFGHGFWLMLKTVDNIWLLTGTTGTTVVIEQFRTPPEPAWL